MRRRLSPSTGVAAFVQDLLPMKTVAWRVARVLLLGSGLTVLGLLV
jgi:hypothetical protein